jgi:hypothetical protein
MKNSIPVTESQQPHGEQAHRIERQVLHHPEHPHADERRHPEEQAQSDEVHRLAHRPDERIGIDEFGDGRCREPTRLGCCDLLNGPDLRVTDFTAHRRRPRHQNDSDRGNEQDSRHIPARQLQCPVRLPEAEPGQGAGDHHEDERPHCGILVRQHQRFGHVRVFGNHHPGGVAGQIGQNGYESNDAEQAEGHALQLPVLPHQRVQEQADGEDGADGWNVVQKEM